MGEVEAPPPGEVRMRAQVALADWLWGVADQGPIVLLIDDAQRLDEASGALIATLAHAAPQHRLMLVSVFKTPVGRRRACRRRGGRARRQ